MMLMELLLSVARTAGPAQARKSDEVHSKRKAIGERERPSTGNKTGNFAFLVQNTNLKPLCLKAGAPSVVFAAESSSSTGNPWKTIQKGPGLLDTVS
jgi:hypothetical protein